MVKQVDFLSYFDFSGQDAIQYELLLKQVDHQKAFVCTANNGTTEKTKRIAFNIKCKMQIKV